MDFKKEKYLLIYLDKLKLSSVFTFLSQISVVSRHVYVMLIYKSVKTQT